jgi:hypothetical protein
MDKKEEVTHGQVVDFLFHIRCEVNVKSKDSIQVYFDTALKPYGNFSREFCPPYLHMAWFDLDYSRNWNTIPQTG